MVSKTALMIWASSLLRQCDAALGKLKDNISFKSYIELQNAPPPLSGSTELFLPSALERAVEKSSWVLHDEAINPFTSAGRISRHKKFLKMFGINWRWRRC